MKGKPQRIDLLKLYVESSSERWRGFIKRAITAENLYLLEHTLYGLQLGMNDLAKQKLNTPKIITWFTQLQRSVEYAIKTLIRKRQPNPLDDPFNKDKAIHRIAEKRARDLAIERHLKYVRF